MGRAWWNGMLLSVAVAMTSAGCQNKVYDENVKLREENRALRDQNDTLKNQPPPMNNQMTQSPAPPLQPAQTQAVIPQAPVEQAPTEQIGGLETKVNRVEGTTTVYLPSGVFFDPGQATLKEDAKASLDKVVAALKGKFAGKKIRVEGHTDSTPIRVSKWASNQQLSEARAKAVKDYLVAHGIDAARITTKGFGDTKPRGTDLAKNRRVEVVVMTAT